MDHGLLYQALRYVYVCVVLFKVGETRRVAEALGERIRVDLELGDELILIGGDGYERRLGEYERLVLDVLDEGVERQRGRGRLELGNEVGGGVRVIGPLDQVHARLILVHRVEHDLSTTTLIIQIVECDIKSKVS